MSRKRSHFFFSFFFIAAQQLNTQALRLVVFQKHRNFSFHAFQPSFSLFLHYFFGL